LCTFGGLVEGVDSELGGVVEDIRRRALDEHAGEIGVVHAVGQLLTRHKAGGLVGHGAGAIQQGVLEAEDGHHTVQGVLHRHSARVHRHRDVLCKSQSMIQHDERKVTQIQKAWLQLTWHCFVP
jgi:hypothetical protein